MPNNNHNPILRQAMRLVLLWQALPGKTAKQIIKLVKLAGDNQQHPDNVFGYGVPDFWKAYQTGKAIK